MKKSLLLFALSLCVSIVSQVFAQTPPGEMKGPPKVLLIVREDIKPGMMPAHNKHSATYAGMFGKLGTTNHRIAMVPIAGSENEVVYLTGADSFAEIEKISEDTDKKMSGARRSMGAELERLDKEAPDLHAGMRDMLAVYRPDLSFNPGAPIPQMRYFSLTTVRVRPGHDAQYVEYGQKILNVAREKAKLDNFHLAAFQVISGAPGGTYLFFRPMKSLSELDQAVGPKVRAAMSDDMKKDADKAVGEAVIISETSTYSFQPRMSYVPKEFAALDRDFWNPAPEVAAKPKPRKRAPKPPPPAN